MNKKALIIFAGIFIALLLFLVLKKHMENTKAGRAFAKLRINGIEIEKTGKETVKLKKEGEEWHIGKWPADTGKVDRIVEGIKKIELKDVISIRKDKYPDFEVTPGSGVVVNVIAPGQDGVKLYVGKRATEWTKNYLRVEGDPAVYIVKAVNKNMFNRDRKNWLDKKIIKQGKSEIKEVKIDYDDKNFTVNKDTAVLAEIVNELKNLRAIEFIEDTGRLKESLDRPYMKIGLRLADGKEALYLIIKDDKKYFAKPADFKFIYEVADINIGNIVKIIEEKSKD